MDEAEEPGFLTCSRMETIEDSPSTDTGNRGPDAADLILVCPHLGDGGVQRVVCTLANAWSRKGRKICIVALYNEPTVYDLDPSVRLIRASEYPLVKLLEPVRTLFDKGAYVAGPFFRKLFPFSQGPADSKLWKILEGLSAIFLPLIYIPMHIRARALRSVIEETGAPTVIGLCGSTNIMTVLAARSLPCRIIISERNDPRRQRLMFPWNPLRPIYYNGADVVTANTRGALEAMRSYVDAEKLVYLPNPLFLPEASNHGTGRQLSSEPSILIVGRLHHQKAHDVLLDAFARLPSDLTPWRLSIVGQGDREGELREQAAALGIADRVDWHGQVSDPFAFYRSAKIFTLASRHEGTPNALLEAMSCGMPVIVSDSSPGPLELVEHDVSGLVVPVDDAEPLASAIDRLARDPGLRERLGEEGRRRASAYDLPKSLATWERLLGW